MAASHSAYLASPNSRRRSAAGPARAHASRSDRAWPGGTRASGRTTGLRSQAGRRRASAARRPPDAAPRPARQRGRNRHSTANRLRERGGSTVRLRRPNPPCVRDHSRRRSRERPRRGRGPRDRRPPRAGEEPPGRAPLARRRLAPARSRGDATRPRRGRPPRLVRRRQRGLVRRRRRQLPQPSRARPSGTLWRDRARG